jgi:carboxyl-terminal processing protease
MKKPFAWGTGLGVMLGGGLGVLVTLLIVRGQEEGGQPAPKPESDQKHAAKQQQMDPHVRLVGEVLDRIAKESLRRPDARAKRQLVEDMINGGLARLDPYAGFLNPRDTKDLDKRFGGKYGGIGAFVHTDRHGQIAIITPIVGSPAYHAGILAGDVILKIDGRSTEGLTLREAIDRITGKKGTPVVLTILHEGAKKPVEVKIVRDEIEVESVLGDRRKPDDPKAWDFLYDKDNKIAYVRLVSFSETTAASLRKTLAALRRQGMRGLVLDLRYNPGGLLIAAVEVGNLFLEDGKAIVRIRRPGQKDIVCKSEKEGSFLPSAQNCPVAVLINRGSASASELVAAALQDHGRAVIVGERSFGKGSVQTLLKVEDKKSRLKLTTAGYFSPRGRNINRYPDSKDRDEWGVLPDPGLAVKLTNEEWVRCFIERNQRDLFPDKRPSPDEAKKPPFVDRVLERALEHLRTQVSQSAAPKRA